MAEVTYREAINRALAAGLAADEKVFLLGEDIAAAGGVFKTTEGLLDRFGAERVRDTPISEQAIIGLAIGSAIQGMRPVAELMFADFAGVASTSSPISSPIPLHDRGSGDAAGHRPPRQRDARRLRRPALADLRELVPQCRRSEAGGPGDPGGRLRPLRAAIEDDDPVLFFEHKGLLNTKGPLDEDAGPLEFGRGEVVRAGDDVTLIATQLARGRALEAADALAAESISVEVIDPRNAGPARLRDDRPERRADEQCRDRTGGASGRELGGHDRPRLVAECFDALDSPPALVAAEETPIPFSTSSNRRGCLGGADRGRGAGDARHRGVRGGRLERCSSWSRSRSGSRRS